MTTAIRIEHRKPPADDAAASAAQLPPEWKWDTLPVLKEVIVVDAPSPDELPAEAAE